MVDQRLSSRPKCLVILGTYNGESFLDHQIRSILQQKGVDVFLLIRDDGSNDGTQLRLEEYSNLINVKIEVGDNVGFSENYFRLLTKSLNFDFDFLAVSDQDDSWNENRLLHAAELLERTGKNFYASRRRVLSNGKMAGRIFPENEVDVSFENALFENVCPGCTQIFTRKGVELVLEIVNLNQLKSVPYDAIIYLIASGLNDLIFDQEANLDYRLHDSNAIGISKFSIFTIAIRLANLKSDCAARFEVAQKLGELEKFSHLMPILAMINSPVSFRRAIDILCLPKLRTSRIENILLKALLIVIPRSLFSSI